MKTVNDTKAKLPAAYFEFEGKEYRIFKREEERSAPWYLYFEFQKERIKRCLASNVQETAIDAAKKIITAVKRGNWEALEETKLRSKPDPDAAPRSSTIGQVIAAYDAAALDMQDGSKRGNVNCLRNCLRRVTGKEADEEIDALSCDLLADGDFARQYFRYALARAKAKQAEAEAKGATNGQQLAARVKRSANSMLNQAKSVFRPKCMAIYRQAGLVLPDLSKFHEGYKEEKFEKVNKAQFNPPGDAVIDATIAAWKELTDRNMFLAIGHELAFGERKSEMGQTRWSWWTSLEGQPFLDGTADVKNTLGDIQVRALDPYYTIMAARIEKEGWRGAPTDYVLSGTETERTEDVFRRISDWLRGLGWQTQKTNHALRAYAGSQVAMRYKIYAASVWLRHSSVKVTESHYTYFITKHRVEDPTKLAARWAQLAPELVKPANIIQLRIANSL